MAKRKNSDIINIRAIFNSYLSKWYLFVISIIGCLLIGLLYIRIHQIEYGVRANVLIQQEDANPMTAALGGLGDLFGASGNVDDEIFVISSHSLYRDVIRDLGLNKTHYVKLGFLKKQLSYPDFPIDIKFYENIADTLSASLKFKVEVNEDGTTDINVKDEHGKIGKVKDVKLPYTFNTPYGDFVVETTEYFPKGQEISSTILVTGYHAAAEDYAEDLYSEIGNKKTNVIELAYNTPNTDMGKALLSQIITRYNERGIREKNAQGQKTAEFIEQRIALLGSNLESTEKDIQSFKENQDLVDLETEVIYQTTKRGELETELIKAETQREILKLTRDFVSDSKNKYELIPTTVDSEAIAKAISEYNMILIERNDMLRMVKEDNSAVVKLTARIDEMRSNIISTIDQYYSSMDVTVRDLKNRIKKNSSRLGTIPRQERAAVDLLRQREVQQTLFIFLLERQEENAMMMANATPKGLTVDEPYVLKEPLGMTNPVILLAMLILGLCLPPVYLYILKLIRNRVETREEVESRTSAPILGEMCTVNSESPLIVTPTSTSSATELFRLIRSNLLYVLNDTDDKVVLLTSSTSGEGKSFISINLAASLALLGKKVLLVGMDIRAPKLASYLNVRNPHGLTQYLASSEIALDDIINKGAVADFPTLDIIVAGPIPPNPAELLISKKVDNMFEELRNKYDYIIVDSAPVGMVSDTFSLNRISNATIYVTRVNRTTVQDVDFIEDIYEHNRLNKLSVVVNGVKSKKVYGYGNKKGSTDY